MDVTTVTVNSSSGFNYTLKALIILYEIGTNPITAVASNSAGLLGLLEEQIYVCLAHYWECIQFSMPGTGLQSFFLLKGHIKNCYSCSTLTSQMTFEY